ncbi:hypothetical protein IQ249_21910 [Lusitaniella coriacea LEGE 07157]|uniref:Uncharacterized protein n=1 Tax=Lusitaniella coriacea LEGE 07157 TaxID=945747 RepID=A0A8J7E1J8_9CYAN|nr:hypothetical protein [Lusitaniella coriacea LEGE 07157]
MKHLGSNSLKGVPFLLAALVHAALLQIPLGSDSIDVEQESNAAIEPSVKVSKIPLTKATPLPSPPTATPTVQTTSVKPVTPQPKPQPKTIPQPAPPVLPNRAAAPDLEPSPVPSPSPTPTPSPSPTPTPTPTPSPTPTPVQSSIPTGFEHYAGAQSGCYDSLECYQVRGVNAGTVRRNLLRALQENEAYIVREKSELEDEAEGFKVYEIIAREGNEPSRFFHIWRSREAGEDRTQYVWKDVATPLSELRSPG